MIDTKMDESFSESDDPVSLNMKVVKLVIDNTPVKRAKNKLGIVMRKALFACGVPEKRVNGKFTDPNPTEVFVNNVQKSFRVNAE